MEHHMYQGVDGIDMDLPTDLELKLFTNTPRKLLWVILQPLFYSLRPLFYKPKPPNTWEIINIAYIILSDMCILYFFGFKSLAYCLISTFLGLGIHPVAGHFIAEHYMFVRGYETYSYYGPLNLFALNVGYHNEHHDFPKIPGSRLPMVKKIAPEYYDTLPVCESWVMVIWNYITDPSIGPFSRVKRQKFVDRKEK
jgi:sphingolipid delta-4 desaturase